MTDGDAALLPAARGRFINQVRVLIWTSATALGVRGRTGSVVLIGHHA